MTDKPRGLWGIMNGGGSTDVPKVDSTQTDLEEQPPRPDNRAAETTIETTIKTTTEESAEQDENPAETPKGLWSVMQQTAQQDTAPVGQAESNVVDKIGSSDSPAADRPKGLWGVMSADSSAPATATGEEAAAGEHASDAIPPNQIETTVPVAPVETAPTEPVANSFIVADSPPVYQSLAVRTGRSKKAFAASLTGLLALPLSALALLPQAWFGLPATIAGFAALMLGLLGWQDVRSSRGRQSGSELAFGGMALGVLAMFLGPIIFARVGQGYRQTFGRQETIDNLESMGDAVQSYHRSEGHFPAGAVFRVNRDGSEQPMHGWMTALLPHLNQQELHRSIHLDVPYDDPANHSAMRQPVNSFLAAGGSRETVGRHQFAPAHFAGLGGELNIDNVGLVRVGIFGRNSNTTRDDITDGLSQTFIAGEISAFYPAWGEPENWRMIGRGLNRDSDGFGNAADTGALFLKADGSVKFYGNKTDPNVLRQLSTPNAGDVLPEHLR